MKKLLVTLTTTLACLGAFAQGKVLFSTDSLHLVYYSATTPADSSLQGQAVAATGSNFPSGITLVADLYMGTSSSALSLFTTTTFSGTSLGKWNQASVSSGFPGLTPPGGATVFIDVQIRDAAFAAPATFTGTPFGTYYGDTPEFTFTLGGSVTYPAMYGTANGGTWPGGTFNMDTQANLAGSRGSIGVVPVPEPASFALAGLGAAAMMIFRRRKNS